MTTTATKSKPAWQAEVTREPRYIPVTEETPEGQAEVTFLEVWVCFVDVFRPGGERIRFRVNRRKDRPLTVTDPRDRLSGTAGATGIWGTLPPQRPVRPRPLTLT